MSQLFKVDLRGLIDLLSDHLYSTPEVYVRELLQNSVDAMAARSAADPNFVPEHHPITIEVIRGKIGEPPTLVISDSGVGLTTEQVHDFLSTIGQSSKRDLARDDYLGQFGIGLLSGFIVSDEIVVTTKSIQSDAKPLKWHGLSDGSYRIETLEHDVQPGTQVYVRAKPGCHDFVDHDVVKRLAERYGGHLIQPIDWICEGSSTPERLNQLAPWSAEAKDETESQRQLRWMQYASQTFDEPMLDAIPIKVGNDDVVGVAYIRASGTAAGGSPGHRVYLKNMLISESNNQVLPPWAFFVRAVINCKSLRPTANREGFYENESLAETRCDISQSIKHYLAGLAKDDPKRLGEIISLHALSIKAMAVQDDDFFRLVIDWMPFETSLGVMKLGDFRRNNETIRYIETRDEFRQVVAVASSQNIGIINAGYTYDEALLMKLSKLGLADVHMMEIKELTRQFEPLSPQASRLTEALIQTARRVVGEHGCDVEIRQFAPASMPAIYTLDAEASFFRHLRQTESISEDLWAGVLDALSTDDEQANRPLLCLNYANPLIRRLSENAQSDVLDRSLEILYVQTLLLGHYPLRPSETAVLNNGLIELINAANHFCESNEDDPKYDV